MQTAIKHISILFRNGESIDLSVQEFSEKYPGPRPLRDRLIDYFETLVKKAGSFIDCIYIWRTGERQDKLHVYKSIDFRTRDLIRQVIESMYTRPLNALHDQA